jgi:hypothetical protein
MAKKRFKNITETLESLKKKTFRDLVEKVGFNLYGKSYINQEIFVVDNEKGDFERFRPLTTSIEKRFINGRAYVIFAGNHAFIIDKDDYDKTSVVWKLGDSIQYHLFLNELEAQRYRRSVLMGIIEKLANEIAALEYVDEGGEFNPSMEYEER